MELFEVVVVSRECVVQMQIFDKDAFWKGSSIGVTQEYHVQWALMVDRTVECVNDCVEERGGPRNQIVLKVEFRDIGQVSIDLGCDVLYVRPREEVC